VFNRRWRMKPGTIPPDPFGNKTDRVQMNPPVASENLLEPAGPTDPDLWLLSVYGDKGPVALLANYALHYVGGGAGDHVSADYFAYFARAVRSSHPDPQYPPMVAILSNGASGNINNIDFRQRRAAQEPYEQMAAVAADLANESMLRLANMPYEKSAKLDARAATLRLGVRKPTAGEVTRAAEIVANAAGRELRSLPEVYAGETLAMKDYPEEVELTLQVLRIGDTVICAIPCEVFVEIGMGLKEASPFRHTVIISLANGYNGYLPTPEQHALGGYETWAARSSYLEVDASTHIRDAALELLAKVR
jgi:hypothetical protein